MGVSLRTAGGLNEPVGWKRGGLVDLEDKEGERRRVGVEWVLIWKGSDELSKACSDKRVSFVVHGASSQHCVSSVATSSVA